MCGKVFDEMPSKCSLCWQHKRAVDVMTNGMRKSDKANGTKSLESFNKMRNSLGPPPSPFSTCVLDFEERNPEQGRGKKRIAQEAVTLVEEHYSETKAKRGARLVMMHKARWMKFAVDTLVMTAGAANDEWLKTLRTVVKCLSFLPKHVVQIMLV